MPAVYRGKLSKVRYRQGDQELRRINLCFFAGGLATFAMIYSTQPLLPVLTRDFNVTPTDAAMSVSATTLTLGVALLFVGPISDRIGRTRVILISLFASSLLCLGTAFVDNWSHLLWLRALLGASVAGLPAVATTYIREEIEPYWATVTIGLYIGGTAIGGMLGRFITGTLAGLFDWRTALAGIGILGLSCALTVLAVLPKSQHFTAASLKPRALTERTLTMVSDPVLFLLYLMGFLAMGTFVSIYNVLGFRLAHAPYNFTLEVAGLIYLTYIFGSMASYSSGKAMNKWGVRPVMVVGCLISLTGIGISAATPTWILVTGVTLITIGFFTIHTTASAWVAGRATGLGPGVSQAGSLYLFAYYLGSSTCGTAAARIWTDYHWPGVLILTGGLTIVAMLIALSLLMFKALGTRT